MNTTLWIAVRLPFYGIVAYLAGVASGIGGVFAALVAALVIDVIAGEQAFARHERQMLDLHDFMHDITEKKT